MAAATRSMVGNATVHQFIDRGPTTRGGLSPGLSPPAKVAWRASDLIGTAIGELFDDFKHLWAATALRAASRRAPSVPAPTPLALVIPPTTSKTPQVSAERLEVACGSATDLWANSCFEERDAWFVQDDDFGTSSRAGVTPLLHSKETRTAECPFAE